jgi:hypothetical protein
MKKVAVLTVVLLLVAGIAYAKEFEVTKKAAEYNVTVKIDRNPPIVGENNMTIEVKDASGRAVTDARVKVLYSMPAMPGMPAMHYKTDAVSEGGVYRAKINPAMAGSWNVSVKVTRAGKTATMRFTIDAH